MQSGRVPAAIAALVGATLATTAALLAWENVALAADGSYQLVRVMATGDLVAHPTRVTGALVHQGAAIAAVQLGVTDTWLLTLLLGFGQLVVPAGIWSYAVWLSRTDVAVLAAVGIAAVLSTSTTWFVNVSESVLVAPLTALLSVLLWLPRPWSRVQAVAAVASAVILVASYETVLVTGAILATWAIARRLRATSLKERSATTLVAVASIASICVALWGMTGTGDPRHAQSLLYFVLSFDPRALYVGIVGFVLVLAASHRRIRNRRAAPLVVGVGITALVLGATMIEATQRESFAARGGIGVVTVLLQFYLCWRWARPWQCDRDGLTARLLVAAPLVLAVACSIAVARGLDDWSRSLHALQRAVSSHRGVLPISDALAADDRAVVWDWTGSSLSLVLRCAPSSAILVDSFPSIVPFPPESSRSQLSDAFVWRSDARCETATAQRGRFSRPPRMHAATSSARVATASQSAMRAARVVVKRPRTMPTP